MFCIITNKDLCSLTLVQYVYRSFLVRSLLFPCTIQTLLFPCTIRPFFVKCTLFSSVHLKSSNLVRLLMSEYNYVLGVSVEIVLKLDLLGLKKVKYFQILH